jgi:hypothetical protein
MVPMHEPANQISELQRREPIRGAAHPILWLGLALAAGVYLATPAQAQQQSGTGSGHVSEQQPTPLPLPQTSADSVFQQRRLRALNAERQKEIVSDANKLLKLTAELNTEISHNKSESFTPEQLRQLARIEKLARSVKDKMSNPVQTSVFEDSFPPPPGISPIGIQ